MQRKWILVSAAVALACLAAGAVALRLRHRAAERPLRAAGAVTLPADTGIVTLTGTIRAQHVVTFGSTGKGNIEAFMAEVGDQVGEGQALARVGAMNLEADRENATNDVQKAQDRVTQAEAAVKDARLEESRAAAELEKAKAVLQRSNDTYAKQKVRIDAGAIPRLEFEKSESDRQIAQQTFDVMEKAWRAASDNIQAMQELEDRERVPLDQAVQKLQDVQAALDATDVRSPVEGWVVARQGQVGQPAESAGEQMFQIATDLAALEVVLDPKPEALKRIYPGMQALVLIPEVTDAAITGDVKAIDGKEAIVEFISSMPAVRPGMKADVRLKLN
jgi:multidrug resistance efflux pump